MSKIKIYGLLTLITVLGLLLRLYHNLDISLWHDEAFSALLIHYPWGEMFYRIGLDVHPPAYYVALRIWSDLLGDSLFALRGFSIFFGLATALAGYAFAREAFRSERAALITALLIAVSPFQIQYATEARMYTFGAFLAVLAAYFLIKALGAASFGTKGIDYILFAVIAGLAALTHYYLLFTVAALCFFALCHQVYYYRTKYSQYTWLIASYAIIAAVFSPWLRWFFFQYKQVGAGYWIPPLDVWSIPTTLWQMLLGIGIDITHRGTQVAVTLATLFSLYVIVWFLRKTTSPYKWLTLLALIAPFGGSLLFAILAHLKGENSSVYLVRYFLYASTFYTIILSVWLANLSWKWLSYLLLSLYVIANLGAFWHYWQDLNVGTKPGMNAAVHYLASHMSPTDHLIAGTSFEFFNLKYYLTQITPPIGQTASAKTMKSSSYSLEDLSDDSPRPAPNAPQSIQYWPRPLLFTGGSTQVTDLPHFAGTAILTNSDLLPHFEDGVVPGDKVWLLWTNGFGSNKPAVPPSWKQEDETGFAEVRPYVGTWIVITKYLVH
jgi:uncharacterized membrane protein